MRAQLNTFNGKIDSIPAGLPGPPLATVVVDSVTPLDPGEAAAVTSSLDGTTVHLQIGLPRGASGADGPAGEVSVAQVNPAITSAQTDRPTSGPMNDAIAAAVATCSANSNCVSILETPFGDPAAETLRQAFNPLLLTQRR